MDETRGHFIILFFNTPGQRGGEAYFCSGFWFPTAQTVFLSPRPEPGGGRADADSCSPFRLHVTPLLLVMSCRSRLSLPLSPSPFLPPLPGAGGNPPVPTWLMSHQAQTSSRAANSGRSLICQPGCILGADCEAAGSSEQKTGKENQQEVKSVHTKLSFEFGPFNRSLWPGQQACGGRSKNILSCICDVLAGDLVPVILTLLFGGEKKEILAAERDLLLGRLVWLCVVCWLQRS